MSTDNVPQNVEAERAVIGSMLQSAQAVREVRGVLSARDFYRPMHGRIFDAMLTLADQGTPVDDGLAVAQLLTKRGEIQKVGGHAYLFELVQLVPTAVNVLYHAQGVREASRLRRVVEHATRVLEIATATTWGMKDGHDDQLSRIAQEALAIDLIVDEFDGDGPVAGLRTWDELLNRPVQADEWVIPGLVARQDVVMVLGGEGAGKSWISRQIAQCLPAGIHPFKPRGDPIPPMRTLLVDLEVSESTLINEARPLAGQVGRLGKWNGGDGWVWHHPEGLNLRNRHDAQVFERVVSETRPDIITFGSLYNAYATGRDSHEQVADELRLVFNRIRSRYRCALWIEHHMPKGDGLNRPITPFGSSVWQRWATHGRAMKLINEGQYELARFRGDRGSREFPAGIYRGGPLPVSPIWDQAEVDLLREASQQ